jgi:hypothetical protein
MTPRRPPLSEKEKAYLFVFLLPPLWPLGIAMLLCDAAEGIANGARVVWHRIKLKCRDD